jgi:hypothetical protein
LEKRYRKLEEIIKKDGKKGWHTEGIKATRKQFPIFLAEPLTHIILEYLNQIAIIKANSEQQPNGLEGEITQSTATHMVSRGVLLFPSPYKVGESLSRHWAYKLVRNVDRKIPEGLRENLGLNIPFIVDGKQIDDKIHLWLHWFRSQRASQLVRDYHYEIIDLLKYFAWTKYETALRYAQKGWMDLTVKMQTAHAVYT